MSFITLTNNGHTYALTPDLRVLDHDAPGQPALGTWGSPAAVAHNGAAMAPNLLECRLKDDTSFQVPVAYDFTAWTNELTVSLDGGQTHLTLPGKIVIDDDYDVSFVVHVVENDVARSLKQVLTIDCAITVADDLTSLQLKLPEGNTIAIEGLAGFQSFEPDHSGISQDALYFKAATIIGNAVIEADIRFQGTWSLDRDSGVATFSVEASGTVDKPTLHLKFGARFGVVDAGLEVLVKDGEVTRVAFVIGGVIEKPSGTTRWQITLGRSGNAYELSVDFAGQHLIAQEGKHAFRGTIAFRGNATLHVGDGAGGETTLKAAFAVNAKWAFDSTDASLDLEVAVTMTDGQSPKIALSGKITWNGKVLSLEVAAKDGGFSVEVRFTAGNLQLYIKLIFGPNGVITAQLAVTYTWTIQRQRAVRDQAPFSAGGQLAAS